MSNTPVYISNIEDLTKVPRDLRIGPNELGFDTRLSQVCTHSEVGDGCDHGDRGGDVVENTVGARLGERETSEGDGRDEHHRADSLLRGQLEPWNEMTGHTKYQSEP